MKIARMAAVDCSAVAGRAAVRQRQRRQIGLDEAGALGLAQKERLEVDDLAVQRAPHASLAGWGTIEPGGRKLNHGSRDQYARIAVNLECKCLEDVAHAMRLQVSFQILAERRIALRLWQRCCRRRCVLPEMRGHGAKGRASRCGECRVQGVRKAQVKLVESRRPRFGQVLC
uniref:Uncharacterized protein n=1 Tax=Prymnesium polylepis TaxID=72548 RepID=A0A7S4M1Q4_9EUKA